MPRVVCRQNGRATIKLDPIDACIFSFYFGSNFLINHFWMNSTNVKIKTKAVKITYRHTQSVWMLIWIYDFWLTCLMNVVLPPFNIHKTRRHFTRLWSVVLCHKVGSQRFHHRQNENADLKQLNRAPHTHIHHDWTLIAAAVIIYKIHLDFSSFTNHFNWQQRRRSQKHWIIKITSNRVFITYSIWHCFSH